MGGLVGAGPAGGAAWATWSARPRRRGSSATRCSCGRHDESDGNRQLLWSLGHKFSSGASGLALATMVAFSAPDALAEVTRQDTSVVETQTTTISEEIKGPASVVKDCRTDSPDLQTVYWVSSRSVGQNPTLYAIDKDGKIIGDEYQVQTRNVGQEEIVFVHRQRKGKKEDFIVLADTSNKFKNRDQLAIYEIAPSVPTAADDQVSPPSSPSFPSPPPSVPGQILWAHRGGTFASDLCTIFLFHLSQRTKVDVEREIDFEFPTAAQEDPRSEKSSSYTIPVGPTPKVRQSSRVGGIVSKRSDHVCLLSIRTRYLFSTHRRTTTLRRSS